MDSNFSASQEQNLRFDDNEAYYIKKDSNFFDTNVLDGLLFIQRTDAISSIVRTITKQQFSSIALIYVTSASGKAHSRVLGWQVSNNGSLESSNVNDILSDPLVSRVMFKAFKQQYQPSSNTKFRASLLKMVNDEIKITTSRKYSNLDVLYQLVGLPNTNGEKRKSMTSIEFVNRVMTCAEASVESYSGFSNSEYVSLRHDATFDEDHSQSASLLASLVHGVNQVKPSSNSDFNKLGQSYILRNRICEDQVYDVACREMSSLNRKLVIEKDKLETRESLNRFAMAFVDAIQTDPTFYSKLIEGVNLGKMYDSAKKDKINVILNRTLADQVAITELSPPQDVIDQLNETRRLISEVFDSPVSELRT